MTTAILEPPEAQLAPPVRPRVAAVAPQPHPKIVRAARVATLNGWVALIAAAVSAPFALFGPDALFVFVGLAVVAYNEFRGRRRLLALDRDATKLLGWNQLGLLALVTAYCCWMIYHAVTSSSPLAAELAANPDLGAVLGPSDQFEALYRQIVVGFYALVILLSAIFQGANAVYYFTRRKYVAA